MMMKKTSLWLVAATAAGFAFGFAGCGGTDTPMTTTCTADSQCAASEACHPVLRRCVTACTAAVDCPDSSRTCATFDGRMAGNDAGVRAFCQCATDALCERGSAGQVCQPATKICGAKCTASSDCPTGSTCDTMTGKCSAATMATDGGAGDGGMTGVDAGIACTPGTCTAPAICNQGTCGAAAACTSGMPQPAGCLTGQACSGAACAEAPFAPASCGNFAAGSTPRAWNPAMQNGPVITQITQLSFAVNEGFCGMTNSKRAILEITAYDPSTPGRLVSETSQPSLRYYRTDGSDIAVSANQIQSYMSSNSNKNVTFRVNLCFPTATNSASVGYAYENGNPVCTTVQ